MAQMRKKPEETALVSESDLIGMKNQIREELMQTEIEPLRERLEIAINAVQSPAMQLKRFEPPTKEQVMNWVAPGCGDERIVSLFIATCEHLHLDPVKKEIYLYEHAGKWVIKVDYKVPIAIAQRDTDYLHFKSWVEYLKPEERPDKPDKLNPTFIKGAYCQIFKRSWVKLAQQVGDPKMGYKEVFAPWDTWRRVKKDGGLFGTWAEKGHFYIEKTAIDHCFRLVYPDMIGALPPSTGTDIIEEEQLTVEAKVLKEHKENDYQEKRTRIDSDFSEASESKEGQPEQTKKPNAQSGFAFDGDSKIYRPEFDEDEQQADPAQLDAIGSLAKTIQKVNPKSTILAEAIGAAKEHNAATKRGEFGMPYSYAAALIGELQKEGKSK